MNKEIYLWVIFFIAIVGIALYLRYTYKPSMDVSVTINTSGIHSIYPFQNLAIPIQVSNTGSSAIKGMGIAMLVNGNQTSYYTITLPSGKSTSFNFNFSAQASGTYNVSAVADPGKVYNIANRKSATSSTSVYVMANLSADPFEYLPGNGSTAKALINSNLFGFEAMIYLKAYYNITMPVFLGGNIGFLSPLLNLTYQYLHNMSVGYYGYANGSYAYLLMLRGYLSPRVVGVAAGAEGLSVYNTSNLGVNITHVKLGKNTTLCSWYAGGWLNSLIYSGNADCIGILLNKYNSSFANPYHSVSEKLYNASINITKDLSYTFISGNSFLVAAVDQIGPTIYIPTIQSSKASEGTCYGVISTVNGTDYCSEILLNDSGGTGKSVSVLRTTELTSKYNATMLAIFNTSKLYSTEASAISIIKGMDLSGNAVAFTPGISSSCSFANSFGCSNVSFANGALGFSLTNLLSMPANVSSIMCYSAVAGSPSHVGVLLAPGATKTISALCYNGTSLISGIPLGLKLNLIANFTANGTRSIATGSAYIPIGQ